MALLEAYTFDDVLIKPATSDIEPHEANVAQKLTKHLTFTAPILSAAMDRVTETDMAIALAKAGGCGVLHRNCTVDEEVAMVMQVKDMDLPVGAACGPFDHVRAMALYDAGVDILVIDCAHGHNQKVIQSVAELRKKLDNTFLIAGNIVTAQAARDLAPYVDAVKVGVGPGSICTTRVISGVGVPQFSAIMDVARECAHTNTLVIADGGIRTPGDMAKALAAGADLVMLGSVFAGTTEAPGAVQTVDGVMYKEYRGMGARSVLEARMSDDRYMQKNRAILPEGIEAMVEVRGSVQEVVEEYIGGLQVSMGYVGARTIRAFQEKAEFVRVTSASVEESRPHSVRAV